MEVLRSLLFVPGNRPDMLQKAATQPADVLVPDLEDSVPVGEKARARDVVREALPAMAQRSQRLIPRINGFSTGLLRDDLAAVIGPYTYGVCIGKVESSWDLQELSRLIAEMEEVVGVPVGTTRVIPLVESAIGVLRAYDICRATPRVVGAALGAEDYIMDAGIRRTETGAEAVFPRSLVALAANAAGTLPLDGPYLNVRDAEGLERDIKSALPLGFKGKFAIHPAQVEPINRLFGPSPEEVEYARQVVQASEKAEAQGRGAVALDGKMIDAPIVQQARNVLVIADSICRREEGRG